MSSEERKKKRPRDLNLPAHSIVEDAMGEEFPSTKPAKKDEEERPKNLHAQALGRLGGRKGGLASAAKFTPEEREERARKAIKVRWQKEKKSKEETSD